MFDEVKSTMINFNQEPEVYGCPMPCELSIFTANKVNVHKNVMEIFKEISNSLNEFSISFFYESTDVEETEEILLVSTSALLGAIGGNFGLFLGVSFLSICLRMVNIVRDSCQ